MMFGKKTVKCECCGVDNPEYSPLFYKVYTRKNGNHIFCMSCLGRYLMENAKPDYRGDANWSIIDRYALEDIVRLDKEQK